MAWLRSVNLRALFAVALVALFLASCAIVPKTTRSDRLGGADALGRCADFFAFLDQTSVEKRVLDPGAFRIEGFPYVRVDRFLASFQAQTQEQEAFSAWVDRLQALDQEARRFEIANRPRAAEFSSSESTNPFELNVRVSTCGDLLRAADFQSSEQQALLRKRARVPAEYLLFWRAVGLYPITRWLVSHWRIKLACRGAPGVYNATAGQLAKHSLFSGRRGRCGGCAPHRFTSGARRLGNTRLLQSRPRSYFPKLRPGVGGPDGG
jgi:hypothetical protein